VQGASDTLNLPVLFDGTQESDSNNDDGDILFNFASATSLTIDQQVDAAVLAPDAALTDNAGQIGGTIMAASIAVDGGEVHNLEFTGTLPSVTVTPEPGTLLLLGTGMLFVVWLAGRRQLALQRLVGKQG
jgi:hypothetical protein